MNLIPRHSRNIEHPSDETTRKLATASIFYQGIFAFVRKEGQNVIRFLMNLQKENNRLELCK